MFGTEFIICTFQSTSSLVWVTPSLVHSSSPTQSRQVQFGYNYSYLCVHPANLILELSNNFGSSLTNPLSSFRYFNKLNPLHKIHYFDTLYVPENTTIDENQIFLLK